MVLVDCKCFDNVCMLLFCAVVRGDFLLSVCVGMFGHLCVGVLFLCELRIVVVIFLLLEYH